jgi:chorismate mutase
VTAPAGHPAGTEIGPEEDRRPEDPGDTDSDPIDAMRAEIDELDGEILRLVKRRTEISQRIGAARIASGGPRIVYSREIAVLARFRDLGTEGRELAMLLLRLGRGKLGSR